MRKQRISRRLLAIVLALSMGLSLLPVTALADGEGDQEQTPVTAGGDARNEDGGEDPPPGEDREEEKEDAPSWGAAALAAGDTYTLVTSVDDIVSGGDFILAAQDGKNFYALGTAIENKITKMQISVTDNTVTGTDLPVWTLAPEGDGVSFFNGTNYLGYGASGTNFTKPNSPYQWNVTMQGDGFRFASSVTPARVIALQVGNKFGAYSTNNTSGYVFDLLVFKGGSSETPEQPPETKAATPAATPASGSTVAPGATVILSCETEGVTYCTRTGGDGWTALEGNAFIIPESAEGTYTVSVKAVKDGLEDSDVLELAYTVGTGGESGGGSSSIADARRGSAGETYTVSGVVTLIATGGRSLYIQDGTGGIDLFFTAAPEGVRRGDTVTASGKWREYRGLLELASAELIARTPGDGTLPAAKPVRIADIGEDCESQLVQVTGAEVTAVSDMGVTIAQDGESIVIYQCPAVEGLDVGAKVDVKAVVSQFNAYQLLVGGPEYIVVTSAAPEEPEPPAKEYYKPENGDTVAIYYPAGGLVLTGEASGTRLKGSPVSVGGGVLYAGGSELMLTAAVDAEGLYTFTAGDGRVLNTGATGGSLTLADPANAVCARWALEAVDGGWMIRSADANFNGRYNQYMEYYGTSFTTYGYTSGDKGIYTMQFFGAENIRSIDYTVDTGVVQTIAQWGGALKAYEDTSLTHISGDLIAVGDELDTGAVYQIFKNGVPQMPLSVSTKPNYYMGGTGLKAGDYAQFALSTRGWGGMTLSFRLRSTGAAAGSWQMQYSVNGTDYVNFTTGSYSASYTSYPQGVATPVTVSGSITDGIARTSVASGQYISFTFDVPAGAEDAETLYIRLVSGNDRSDGKDTDASGNIRIDTVKLTGSPIVSDRITSYVQVDPDGSEEAGSGTAIRLTSEEGAVIFYGWADSATGEVGYTTGGAPVVPEDLPATLFVKAQAPGKAESVTRALTYLPASVAGVKMSPNGGGVYTGDGPVAVELTASTAGAAIYYTRSDWPKVTNANGEEADDYRLYDPAAGIELRPGFGALTISAYAEKEGFTPSAVTTRTFTERSSQTYQLFFGQMHSHTGYSDGAGTAQQAYASVKALEDAVWNMDFLSVTDHSNSFDDAGGSKRINDAPAGTEWNEGKALAKQYTDGSFVGIFGYEMTWSNGLGHINTFNTTGYQDRTQSSYTAYSTALQNYYAELKTASDSISQFNHPGTTFGDFSDFSYYDEEIDRLITLIEVGNGEGAIGSSGYFPSYEYYTRALDKGWHVAPTNNQDNHKGGWGTANTGRDVVLVDELTEEAIYDAMRNYRVYATEDLNLEIYYTFDGSIMGSILDADSYAGGDTAVIEVKLSDRDDAGAAKVEVIVNGGAVAAAATASCNETVTLEVPVTYSYYYIRVTQADGDIAVTAPVWVGEVEAVGVSGMHTASGLTVAGQEQGITLELYNNESRDLEISSIVFTDKATGRVLHTVSDVTAVPKLGTASASFTHVFDTDGIVTVTAEVRGTLNGVEKVYTQDLELTVMPANIVSRIVVDGTHYNDYVTGYYGGNMNNMTAIAAGLGVEVTVKTDTLTAEDLADCRLLVVSAPARTSDTANAGVYTGSTFSDEFIQLVKDYVEGGGSVAVCGLADYQDKKADSTQHHAGAQLNRLLEAIGSTMRINDDEAYDEERNGGQPYRLYPEIFNTDSRWCAGIVTAGSGAEAYQTYSQYSGCTVDPGQGTWLVRGFDTTYSIDSDGDGRGGVEKGQAYFLACEDTGFGGTVFASGGVFLSDFEVKAELDNIWDLPYANRTIFENMLDMVREGITITPISETRRAPLNKIFAIEGYVTSGTANPNTTFFDSIYVQDASGGTDVFPYAAGGLAIGTKVRVLGYTDAYQGDRELQVLSLEILDGQPHVYEPRQLTTAQAADYDTYGGQLVATSGTVSGIVYVEGVLSQFRLTDSTGVPATVFIDGYITSESGRNTVGEWIAEGQTVSAAGLLYSHPEGDSDVSVPVLRVRNCDEIRLVSAPPVDPDEPTPPVTPTDPADPVDPPPPVTPVVPTPTPTPGTGGSARPGPSGGSTEIAEEDTPLMAVGPVTTDLHGLPGGGVITETRAVLDSAEAQAVVSQEIADEIIRQAVSCGSDLVVIAHSAAGGETGVTLSGSAVAELAVKTAADLRLETAGASVTIPHRGLSGLAEAGGQVAVSVRRSGDSLAVTITADGRRVDQVAGGVRVRIPLEDCGPGTVAMLVREDGSLQVVRRSAAVDGALIVPLSGSAEIVIADNSVSFRDVSPSSWMAGAVAFVSSRGLMNGTGADVFDPGASMTRGMLAMVLHNLEDNPAPGAAAGFADVSGGAWYAEAVAWAAARGIVGGYADGSFGPGDPITREQLAVMLYRYAGSPGAGAFELDFVDADSVSGYAREAVTWAAANGILNGRSGGVLDPQGNATRAEVAQMLLNFVSGMA